MKLNKRLLAIKEAFVTDKTREGCYRQMEFAFIKLGVETRGKKQTQKAWWLCDPVDFKITEQTMRQQFKSVFGAECDIFAKMLYMRMADNKEQADISFDKFANVFEPFFVSIKTHLIL